MKFKSKFSRTILLLIIAVFFLVFEQFKTSDQDATRDIVQTNQQLEVAFREEKRDVPVSGSGTVVKLLADDLKGSKHQKFIVKITDQMTLLVSHNIDLAPRINTLKVGDEIEFSGEYIWNQKGGILHWTHHDPAGKHPGGWLRHKGNIYK